MDYDLQTILRAVEQGDRLGFRFIGGSDTVHPSVVCEVSGGGKRDLADIESFLDSFRGGEDSDTEEEEAEAEEETPEPGDEVDDTDSAVVKVVDQASDNDATEPAVVPVVSDSEVSETEAVESAVVPVTVTETSEPDAVVATEPPTPKATPRTTKKSNPTPPPSPRPPPKRKPESRGKHKHRHKSRHRTKGGDSGSGSDSSLSDDLNPDILGGRSAPSDSDSDVDAPTVPMPRKLSHRIIGFGEPAPTEIEPDDVYISIPDNILND
jgi:hypothetical protein